jgi:hypothetical protein
MFLWGACAYGAEPDWRLPAQPRVVAFGDVHGAFAELTALLEQARLIDESLDWQGGTTHLVSLGDLLDRGDDSRRVLDLLMKLEGQAAAAGGRVHVVLGNHEVMNLTGDLRYVSAGEFAAFATADEGDGTADEPRGFRGHRAAFAPGGRYGAWLRNRPALLVIGDTAFVHGGIGPGLGDVATLNARVAAVLATAVDEAALASEPAFRDSGPFWYRGTALCHALVEEPTLAHALAAIGVSRVAIGHTPTASARVESRFNGRVLMIDSGMLASHYKGRASALVLEGESARVLVAGESAAAEIGRARGAYSGDWGAREALVNALATAPIVARTPIVTRSPTISGARVDGVRRTWAVTLEVDGRRVPAQFLTMSKEARVRELGALALDRLLGLGIVRASAVRTVDGDEGLMVEGGLLTERARLEAASARPEPCAQGSDFELVRAFDALVAQEARTPDDLGYDRRAWEARIWRFAAAFSRSPRIAPDSRRVLPAPFIARLRALDRASVEAALAGLDRRAAAALMARRDAILDQSSTGG